MPTQAVPAQHVQNIPKKQWRWVDDFFSPTVVKAVVCVDELHYTHDDISRRFRDGRFLDETVCALNTDSIY